MSWLDTKSTEKLIRFAKALVDQQSARVMVPAQQAASGFWFGGGNLIEAADGTLYLVGRYRNAGDSRQGVDAGVRGLELAIFASRDRGQSFEKVQHWSKDDLTIGDHTVLSIEGSALRAVGTGFELFVSTEKDNIGYPRGFEDFLKPGTGVWTIDRLAAPTIAALHGAAPRTILSCDDPRFVHVKDPFVDSTTTAAAADGDLTVLFCTHPFSWTSSNTAYAIRPAGVAEMGRPVFDFFPRGFTWDVAMTRGTCVVDVPQVGVFAERPIRLMFYDGGECVRDLDPHRNSVARPRGYSCEELGGVAYFPCGQLGSLRRLSVHRPLLVSPYGTGCSRYVDVLKLDDGYLATWQQSQSDRSQPLVMNYLSREKAEELLA